MVSNMDKIFWTAVEVSGLQQQSIPVSSNLLQQVPASMMANVVRNSLRLSEQLSSQTCITFVGTCNASYCCFLAFSVTPLLQIICDIYSVAKASRTSTFSFLTQVFGRKWKTLAKISIAMHVWFRTNILHSSERGAFIVNLFLFSIRWCLPDLMLLYLQLSPVISVLDASVDPGWNISLLLFFGPS